MSKNATGPQVDQNREDEGQSGLLSTHSELSEREQVKSIRAEIWRLVQAAPDLETVHWYCWTDDCFENDEFLSEDWSNLKWRVQVLNMKHQPVTKLANMIDRLVPESVKNAKKGVTT